MKFNIISCYFVGNQQIYKTSKNQLVGGAEIYLYDLSQFLISLGHKVKVIQIGDKNEEFLFDNIEIKRIKLPGICRRIGFIPENYYEFNWFWKKHLDRDIDYVHLHYLQHAWPFASKDMTATCHGIDWDIPKKEYIKYYKQIYPFPYKHLLSTFYHFNRFVNRKIFSNFAIKKLKKIVSVDSSLLRYVQSELPDYRNKIEIIHNYVDTNTFKPQQVDQDLKRIYEGKFVILFPRNLSINRGIHYAIEAMGLLKRKYPEILLIITGEGIAKDYIIKRIKELKLEKNIITLGHLDHFTDLPKYYNLTNLVIIPTAYSEGTSLACLEAMATAKPVIVTNVGGLYDIIQDNENGMLIQPDVNQLVNAIEKLIENSALREKFGNSALETVRHSFDKTTWQKKYKKFFNI